MHGRLVKGLAVLGTTGALIGGGAALANAATGGSSSSGQSSTQSGATTTPAPSARSQSGSPGHCPHDQGSGSSGSAYGGSGPATNPTT